MKLKIAAVLLLTTACLVWALWGIDPALVAVSLGNVQWLWGLPMAGLFIVAHSLRTTRLNVLLDHPVSFAELFSVNSVGYLAINVVPLRLGEFVRPYLLLEKHKVPFGASMAAIFVERLLDILMLLSLLAGVGWLVELPPQGVVVGGLDVVAAGQRFAAVIAVGGLLFVGALVGFGKPVLALVERLMPAPLMPLMGFLRGFQEGLTGLARQPARAANVLVQSVIIWVVTIVAVQCVMIGFEGVPGHFQAAALTWTITITGMTVAPTPGFFGAFEAFCMSSLMLWEVPKDLGTTFAVILHLGQFGFTVLLGGIYMVKEGLSLREVIQASRVVAEDAPQTD